MQKDDGVPMISKNGIIRNPKALARVAGIKQTPNATNEISQAFLVILSG